MYKQNRVSPVPDSHKLEYGMSDWSSGKKDNGNSTVRRRREKSFVPGTDEYEAYIEKRVFNKRHAWTPHFWERKRDKNRLGGVNPTRGWEGWKYRQKMRWNSIKYTWREWTASMEIWRRSLKQIESHQGTGVVSYFIFLRFLLFLNIFIFLMMFFVVVLFQVAFPTMDYNLYTTGVTNNSEHAGVLLAENCTQQYKTNDTSGFQLVLDFFQGTGWMETTAFFYGYYSNTHVTIPGGQYNIPLAYFLATLFIIVVSLIVMIHHTFSKYMDTFISTDTHVKLTFFKSVFGDWDYRVNGEKPISLLQKGFYNRFSGQLEEYRHELKKKNQTSCKRCCLWFVRILINFFIIILLIGGAASIYFAQTFSSDFTTSNDVDNYDMIIVLFVSYLPSIIIAVMNAIFPLLFGLVVKAEDYTPSVVIKITILRTVFVRLAALAVITSAIYKQITCSPSNECLVGTGSCPQIQCWETYFGQQLYKLTVTEFLVDILLTLAYELPRKLLTTKCDCKLGEKIGPAVFDVPINVLDLVYAQALCWFGFFFAPLLPALCVVRLTALFYLRKLSALYNTVPPDRPYQSARSNAFFMITLLITFFLVAVPVGYTLVTLRPSPMCGPFRIYDIPTDIVTIQIDTAETWVQTLWTIITSSAFIAVIFLLLGMALYYCSALKSANSTLISNLKHQVLQDEKDKQYLIVQLSKLTQTNNPPTGPSKPSNTTGQTNLQTKPTTQPPPYKKQADKVNFAPSGAAPPGVVPESSDILKDRNINWDSPRVPDDKNKAETPSDVVVNDYDDNDW